MKTHVWLGIFLILFSVTVRSQETKAGPAMAEELEFDKGLVVEGKVEKPQVQFPLLKEPPPKREIPFEHSFMPRLLESERENTFTPGDWELSTK